jgi:hypothetical protein
MVPGHGRWPRAGEPDENLPPLFFSSIRVIAKSDHVGLGSVRSPAQVFGFIVMFLRLGEMLIDALKVSPMVFLRMMPDQKWVDREGSVRAVLGRQNVAQLQCLRAFRRAAESAQLSLRVLIRNRSCIAPDVGWRIGPQC